jgi:hypothetical protein
MGNQPGGFIQGIISAMTEIDPCRIKNLFPSQDHIPQGDMGWLKMFLTQAVDLR